MRVQIIFLPVVLVLLTTVASSFSTANLCTDVFNVLDSTSSTVKKYSGIAGTTTTTTATTTTTTNAAATTTSGAAAPTTTTTSAAAAATTTTSTTPQSTPTTTQATSASQEALFANLEQEQQQGERSAYAFESPIVAGGGGGGGASATTTILPKANKIPTRAEILLFPTLPVQSIAQQDLSSKLSKYKDSVGKDPQGGGMAGMTDSASYKFLVSVAAVARFTDAPSWDFDQVWKPLRQNTFSASLSTKPWILDLSALRDTLTSTPFSFDSSQLGFDINVDFNFLKQKLALGSFVAVVYQSQTHNSGVCSSWAPVNRGSIHWAVDAARTIPALVVGIDTQFIYLVDPCEMSTIKIPRAEFLMRWHGCLKIDRSAGGAAGKNSQCLTGVAFWFAPVNGNNMFTTSAAGSSSDPSTLARVITNDPSSVPAIARARRE